MPVVAVVEWHQGGHYPIYFRFYCLALLRLDCTVIALCPDPDQVHAWLAAALPHPPSLQERLHLVKFAAPAWPIRPSLFRESFNNLLFFPRLRRTLLAAQRRLALPVNLVFFTSIDEPLFQHFPKTARGFSWKWAGLYLQCRIFRHDRYSEQVQKLLRSFAERLSHPGLQAIGLLEEDSADAMRQSFPEIKTVVFPDFVDTTPPGKEGPHRDLVRFSNGRPVVGLIGHLQPRKGIITLAKAALDPANAHIVFAFAGDVIWPMFSPDESRLLEHLRSQANVWTHFHRISSEEQFNGLVATCDIVFAAYSDFPHSSNLLGKAAWFGKPVIVSDGYVMAQRVREHDLGLVIPENDVDALRLAIHSLLHNLKSQSFRRDHEQAAYNSIHSPERLGDCLLQVIG